MSSKARDVFLTRIALLAWSRAGRETSVPSTTLSASSASQNCRHSRVMSAIRTENQRTRPVQRKKNAAKVLLSAARKYDADVRSVGKRRQRGMASEHHRADVWTVSDRPTDTCSEPVRYHGAVQATAAARPCRRRVINKQSCGANLHVSGADGRVYLIVYWRSVGPTAAAQCERNEASAVAGVRSSAW